MTTDFRQRKTPQENGKMRERSESRTVGSTVLGAILILIAAFFASGCTCPEAAEKAYHHVVVLGDPHLPGKHLAHKERVRRTINSWPDVDLVIAVGDICDEYGTEAEFTAARAFFAKLDKPLAVIAGNHDVLYTTPSWPGGGGYQPASPATREAKLALFRRTFGLAEHWYSRDLGGYLLLFLSTDREGFAAGMSEPQLAWLRTTLAAHPATPTIIVFHGPLPGTQYPFKQYINRPQAVAQPVEAIHVLIAANPQVFLWVSGHTHTPATEASYAAPINVYAGQVTNIHNADMKRERIWTNSLLLYPDKVVVRTYDHQERAWMPKLERTISPPKL